MPRHTKRLKIRPKDLRRPDEFETLTGQAMAWVTDHQQMALGVAAAILGVVIIVLIVGRVSASRAASASEGFRAAYAAFQAGKSAEAAESFGAVARDYPRTPFGRMAALYRAHALARQGDADAAATAYAEYLAGSPDGYLRQEALAGLARAKETTGDRIGALQAYTEAGTIEGPFRVDALLAQARLEEVSGRGEEARAIYAGLLKEAPDPQLRAFLLGKLPPGTRAPDVAANATASP